MINNTFGLIKPTNIGCFYQVNIANGRGNYQCGAAATYNSFTYNWAAPSPINSNTANQYFCGQFYPLSGFTITPTSINVQVDTYRFFSSGVSSTRVDGTYKIKINDYVIQTGFTGTVTGMTNNNLYTRTFTINNVSINSGDSLELVLRDSIS